MISHRPSYLICAAVALLPLTVLSLNSQKQSGMQEDLEGRMTDTPQLEYRWAKPSEGRQDYTFVAYDPKKQAIVGEIRFYLEAEIRTNELDEDLVDSGVPAEMLKAMVKAIPEAKLEVGNVAWESDGFDSFKDKHFKDAGFVVEYEDGEPYADYNIPPKAEAL